jgi:tRNA threonylcarbamoyladenosine biosynthesis protein TsaE
MKTDLSHLLRSHVPFGTWLFLLCELFVILYLMQKEFSLNELSEVVSEFLNNLQIGDKSVAVGLCGDLGSGKTTFVKELAKQLRVEREVTSPTFTVMQKYEVNFGRFKNLVHLDLYRFEEFEETKVLRLEEIFNNSENLILIEWVDKFPEIKTDIKINLKHKTEITREIKIIYG